MNKCIDKDCIRWDEQDIGTIHKGSTSAVICGPIVSETVGAAGFLQLNCGY